MTENELYHWGILGQKWGIRRFQNPDGTLTEEGRERYLRKVNKLEKKKAKITSQRDSDMEETKTAAAQYREYVNSGQAQKDINDAQEKYDTVNSIIGAGRMMGALAKSTNDNSREVYERLEEIVEEYKDALDEAIDNFDILQNKAEYLEESMVKSGKKYANKILKLDKKIDKYRSYLGNE